MLHLTVEKNNEYGSKRKSIKRGNGEEMRRNEKRATKGNTKFMMKNPKKRK